MARKPTDTVQLKLRFPEALRRRLEREAKRHGRSLNSEILAILENAFRKSDDVEQRARAFADALGDEMCPSHRRAGQQGRSGRRPGRQCRARSSAPPLRKPETRCGQWTLKRSRSRLRLSDACPTVMTLLREAALAGEVGAALFLVGRPSVDRKDAYLTSREPSKAAGTFRAGSTFCIIGEREEAGECRTTSIWCIMRLDLTSSPCWQQQQPQCS
jgi:hypothetical protein